MKTFKINIDKYKWLIISLFFLIFLFIGVTVYKDYGISVDEPLARYRGLEYFDLITKKDPLDLPSNMKYYGPLFSTVLAFIEKTLNLSLFGQVFYVYHLFTFLLFFVSVICFFFIGNLLFGNWKYSLLGCLLLIISPRIFADSFYNPKDIPFMCFFIISFLSLLIFLRYPSPYSIAFHGITTAALIATRIMGIYMIALTIGVILYFFWMNRKDRYRLYLQFIYLIEYIAVTIGFIAIFWPLVYFEPVDTLIKSITTMGHYPWKGWVLFLGQLNHSYDLPWTYLPIWIAITTPIAYTIFFLIGSFHTITTIVRAKFNLGIRTVLELCLVLAFFYGPFLYSIIFKTNLYNAWRQMFFIYPPFIILAIYGGKYLFSLSKQLKGNRLISLVSGLLLAINIITTLVFMFINHPFENVYFSRLAGKDMQTAKMQFDLDYWGLSYKQAFENILATDKRDLIRVCAVDIDGHYQALVFPLQIHNRIKFVKFSEKPDFFISTYLRHPQEYTDLEPYFSISVGNARIIVVYKMDNLKIDGTNLSDITIVED
jgi:hypothetical protein